MKVTVYGAGAIGGTTGAALARAGHDVLLVDSHAPHVEAINARGLTIERDGQSTTTRVPAVLPSALGHDLPLLLLAVTTHQTAALLPDLDSRLAASGTLVPLRDAPRDQPTPEAVGASR